MESYYDVNGDAGGYLIKGQVLVVRLAPRPEHQGGAAELPGEGLRNGPAQHLGKGTYALSQNNKVSGYARLGPEVAAQPAGHVP